MNRELYPLMERLIDENGLTLEDLQNILNFIEETTKKRLAKAEGLREKKEDLVGKYFIEYIYGEPLFYKVLAFDSEERFICIVCPSFWHDEFFTHYDENNEIDISNIHIETLGYDQLKKMSEIDSRRFSAAVRRWCEELLLKIKAETPKYS